MITDNRPIISGLRALRDSCLARLEANEDWRALKVLERAIVELDLSTDAHASAKAVPADQSSSAQATQSGYVQPTWAKPKSEGRQISQSDASFSVVTLNGPTTVADLIPLVREQGAQVNGNDPQTNLSSSLSRDGRFKSVRINGIAHWALKDPDDAVGGETGAGTPASEDLLPLEGR